MVSLLKGQLRLIVSLLISVLFLAWAWRNWAGDAGSIAAALKQANYWFLLPALLVYFLGVWLRAAAALFLGALAAVFVVGSSRPRAVAIVERVERTLPASLQGRIAPLVDRFIQGLDCLQSARLSLAIVALTIGAWLCEATMYLIVALGF